MLCAGRATAQTPIGLLDAVTQTIKDHPDVLLRQDDVASARGDLHEAHGRFDTRLTTALRTQRANDPQLLQLGFVADSLFYTSQGTFSTYSLGFEKQLRTGLSFRPQLQMDRNIQTIAGFAPDGSDATLPLPGQNRLNMSFQLTQPLMRGRGRDAVTAYERAAASGVDASRATLRHTIASSVLRTTVSY